MLKNAIDTVVGLNSTARFLALRLSLSVILTVIPAAAYAQASIVGVVKDASNAVLPGVTVEVSSPALIERVRSVTTDNVGQYRVENLVPGVYAVTFTLPGFSTVTRGGVQLTGSFTATVDAAMGVGALEETVTVTGETPVVDVQSARSQRVLDHDVIDVIPSGRNQATLAVLIPGVSFANTAAQDVGGSSAQPLPGLVVHGSRQIDQSWIFSGVTLGTFTGMYGTPMVTNPAAMQELAFDTAAVGSEVAVGGVRVNMIPRDGGNSFRGTFFGGFMNHSLQGNNLTQDLKDRGFTAPNDLDKNWDVNPGLGGPLRKDLLWFYGSVRSNGAFNNAGGIFHNANANNPNAWTYVPQTDRQGFNHSHWEDASVRLTWQANSRNKLGAFLDIQTGCLCPQTVSATVSPEAGRKWFFPREHQWIFDWTSPLTNRFLLEATLVNRADNYVMDPVPGLNPLMIAVTEQSTGLIYRAGETYHNILSAGNLYRVAASYVTGAHSFKVGFNDAQGFGTTYSKTNQPISYRFNNGVANQLTQWAYPLFARHNVKHDLGLFVQDKWTVGRLTASGGARLDYFAGHIPEIRIHPTQLTPTQNLLIPATDGVKWTDLSPKMAVVYDLLGNRKTALKASLNRYLGGQAWTNVVNQAAGLFTVKSDFTRYVQSTTRQWTDGDSDFVADCDLLSPAANGECGAMANSNFGKLSPGVTYDPDVLEGFNHRFYNWEFMVGVQQELLPRLSVDAAFFRRSYGNLNVTDNLAVGAGDYNTFSLTAPTSDSRLPNAGQVVSGLLDLNPSKFGVPAQPFVTFAETYGKQSEVWQGVDVSLNARPSNGLLFQGGLSTGQTITDNCEVVAKVPEVLFVGGAWTPASYCHQATKWLPQFKGLAAYTIPRVDVSLSGTIQSSPGPAVLANYVATNAVVAPSLGRNLSGGVNTQVQLVPPGSLYGERLNQLDIRIAKILRRGRTRIAGNFDVYNALNSNAVLAQNNLFAVWQRPVTVVIARFAKFSVQVDF